jgi:rubredoxin
MLDPLPIGEELRELKLKCELCGMVFDADTPEEKEDCAMIDVSGRCVACYEEWGDEWPDRA